MPCVRVLAWSSYESVGALNPVALGGGVPVDMGAKLLCLFLASALLAYYIYTPIPEDLEEPWKVMFITAAFRAMGHLVSLVLGLVRGWPGGESYGAEGVLGASVANRGMAINTCDTYIQ